LLKLKAELIHKQLVRQIPTDRLKIVWQCINESYSTDKPMPIVDAFVMDEKSFTKFIQDNYDAIIDGALWEYNRLPAPIEINAINYQLVKDSSNCIMLREDCEEIPSLIHELLHIYREDYLRFKDIYEIIQRK
jgi:hypothetical protein